MISYCICCLRPTYDRMLIEDLIRKTSVPYEILLWLNTPDQGLREFVQAKASQGAPVRVVGDTPENVGMVGFRHLFLAARHEMVVQIDDDVIRVSPRIAEHAKFIFERHPSVRQLTADVCQDSWTTGARPPMDQYRRIDDGIYDGPIDGWFSVYHRSILPLVLEAPFAKYVYLGNWAKGRLAQAGFMGALCTRFKVFHVNGPAYSSYFGMREFEVEKYRSVGRQDIADWYGDVPAVPRETLDRRVAEIRSELDSFGVPGGREWMRHTLLHALKPTDIHQHLMTLYGLAVGLDAKVVLEFGVNTGESTVALLEAVHATGGRLTSVDLQECAATREMVRSYGLADRWAFVKGDDLAFGHAWDPKELVDMVFIDTSHEYVQTVKEIALFEPLVRPGGLLVFHDTHSFHEGVMRPIEEFLAWHPYHRFVNHPHCNGLGIMRKPSAVPDAGAQAGAAAGRAASCEAVPKQEAPSSA